MRTPMTAIRIPRATSMTHQHLLTVINTRVKSLSADIGTVRVCDMGCGDGHLLGYLAEQLPRLNPDRTFEFHGVEVSDSNVQPAGFFDATVGHLEGAAPDIDWRSRLHMVASSDPWPFADGTLHLVVSNQVLEHVFGHEHFFSELHRTLADGGFSAHLFPLIHVVWEGHLRMPLVHRIRQHNAQVRYIRQASRLGLGLFRGHRRALGSTLDRFSEEHADYMTFLTNYKSWAEMLALTKAAGLRSDFEFTERYYGEKLRSRFGGGPRAIYRAGGWWRTIVSYLFCKRIASVTLNTEKRQTYAR